MYCLNNSILKASDILQFMRLFIISNDDCIIAFSMIVSLFYLEYINQRTPGFLYTILDVCFYKSKLLLFKNKIEA